MGSTNDSKGWVLVAEATTVHCPGCGARVSAASDAEAVACPHCRTAFSPWGLPTAVRDSGVGGGPPPGGPARDGARGGAPAARASEVPDAREAADPLLGTRLGGCLLVRVIGRGGMGTVYEAEDPVRGRVAVKVLPEDLARDADFVSRFRREAKVQSGLSHPHVVEVFERGEEGGRCFFVMEHVRGESLRRPMERGPIGWRDAARVATEILVGLGYAHGRGVVHRDLKPENVLLGDDGRVRLVDFGLSRIVRGEALATTRLTRTDVILGTYEYMAPEQRTGAPDVDERADLYALGVILYEMLTGALPLGRFEPASVLRPGCPPAFDAVIHRALATRPSDRFPSAVAFREALDEAVRVAGRGAGHARAAPPPPPLPAPAAPSRAHGVLKHVDLIATGDRVMGILLVLAFFGLVTLGGTRGTRSREWLFPWLGLVGMSSIVALVGGILLLKQGKRLRAMAPGSREGQITASAFLLVIFPPLGTALGIYGLVTLLSDSAREAFALGRRGLASAAATPRAPAFVAPPPLPVRRHGRRRGPFGAFLRAALVAGGAAFLAVALFEPHGGPDVNSLFATVFCAVFLLSVGGWWVLRGRHEGVLRAPSDPAVAPPRAAASAWPGFVVFAVALGLYLGGLIWARAGDSGQPHDSVAHWVLLTIPPWFAASLLGGWTWRRFGSGAAAVLLLILMGIAWGAAASSDPTPVPEWPYPHRSGPRPR